ncbi:hypothetical protein FRB98_005074 [Tulasnella sp. 332]|nr:hypothetical protein FRB98_005074 [Tulasnella sp. 332]
MAIPEQEQEPEHLARFREEWKKEVQNRLNTSGATTQSVTTSTSTAPNVNMDDALDHRIKGTERSPSPVARMKRHGARGTSIPNANELEIAQLAISDSMPEGSKGKATASALDQYKQAVEAEQQGHFDHAVNLYKASFKRDPHIDKAYQRFLETSSATQARKANIIAQRTEPHVAHVPDTLRNLLSGVEPSLLTFIPEDEKLGVPLDQLPDELIVHILRELANVKDVASIERHLVNLTYVKPQITDDLQLDQISTRYGDDYRHMYISHPRVRMDGIYISGHYVGQWQLEGTTVVLEDLLDSEGLFTRYAFEMVLELQSRPVGRWNRLSIKQYNSVNLSTDESQPLALTHERPFWFSKVRSFLP